MGILTDLIFRKLQGFAESMQSVNDKRFKHTRESLLAKLEANSYLGDYFELNRQRAIQHLKQGNTLRAKYYIMLMKRRGQDVMAGSDDEV